MNFIHPNGQNGSASHLSEITDRRGDGRLETPLSPITPTVEVRPTCPNKRLDWSDDEDEEQVHPNKKSEDLIIVELLKVSIVSAWSSLCTESGHPEQQEEEEVSASVSHPPADRMTGSTQHGKC